MRVLLIYPFVGESMMWMPLGLPFIAAQLRARGHAVAIFDRYAIQRHVGATEQAVDRAMLDGIREFKPDLVGLNTLTPLIYDTAESAKLIRTEFAGMLVAGGYHATALPELTLLKIPELDGVVAGEGEFVFTRLADGESPRLLPGVWWREGGFVQAPAAPPAQIADLDSLPLPALDLMDMDFYTQRCYATIRGHNMRAATLVTSRGCYRRCRFCAESLTYGRGVRFHSAAYTLDWIQRLITDHAVDGLHFHDNDFLANEARVREICEGLLRQGLSHRVKWSIQARAERLTPEIAALLRSAGCVLVEIGVEAGTQAELDRVAKGSTVEENTRAVAICREAGLEVHAYMLNGMEGETIPDLEQRLAWVKQARPTSFQWSQVAMYPGTLLYREKGGDFFARSEWTREAISAYYSEYGLSRISPELRRDWMRRRADPFFRRFFWSDAIRRYPAQTLARIAWLGLRAKTLNLARLVWHVPIHLLRQVRGAK